MISDDGQYGIDGYRLCVIVDLAVCAFRRLEASIEQYCSSFAVLLLRLRIWQHMNVFCAPASNLMINRPNEPIKIACCFVCRVRICNAGHVKLLENLSSIFQ